LAALEDLQEIFGVREIVVARELTKKFEEVICARPAEILAKFLKNPPRGELVVVI
jgi:16S rRNA (cytidine1402-2'-O)-methyltransferase